MGKELNLLKFYPKSSRPIEERGNKITEKDRAVARKFDKEYFDGDRLTGYGGYDYHPRFWTDTVSYMAEYYNPEPISALSSVLDYKVIYATAKLTT